MKLIEKTRPNSNKATFVWKEKVLFNIILFAIPLFLLIIFEIGLRISNYGKNLGLFIESEVYPGYYEINPDVNLRYFTKLDNTSPSNDIFLIEKPDTCYRIFVLGGSTTRGFPYQESVSFPRILYYRLQDAFPSKRIEVVNLSAAAINSYSYIDMVDEIIDKEPDAILVYGGHNEYYGALGVASIEGAGNIRWIKKLRLKLVHFRTFQLMQNIIEKITHSIFGNTLNPRGTLMERIVKDKYVPLNSSLYQKGLQQFDENLTELVKRTSREGIPVVLSEIVSNINDLPPFKSDSINELSAIEYYNAAKQKELEGKIDEAKELYEKAKDLDLIRFRAPEAINEILNCLSIQNKLVIVPMLSYFENASPNELIGDEFMVDHLHPNVDGYFLIADAFFNTLKEHRFIEKDWDSNCKPSSYYRNNWGFTPLDSMIADIRIQTLKEGWPFKQNNDLNRSQKTYLAKGIVGKMATDYYNNKPNRHFEDGHIELATYYAEQGLYNKAFNEYLSLIKLHPYLTDLYYDASNYLIAGEKYGQALDLINSAPGLKKNYNYYYTVGIIKLELAEYKQAIIALEKAFDLKPESIDPTTVLIPLYNGYKNVSDKKNEERVLKLIQEIIPQYREETNSEILNIEIYEKAESYIVEGEFKKAEELLNKLIQTKETATSYKLLAMSFIKQKDYATAYEYCTKSYELDSTDQENLINYFNLNIMKNDFRIALRLLGELEILNIDKSRLKQLNDLYIQKKQMYDSNKQH